MQYECVVTEEDEKRLVILPRLRFGFPASIDYMLPHSFICSESNGPDRRSLSIKI